MDKKENQLFKKINIYNSVTINNSEDNQVSVSKEELELTSKPEDLEVKSASEDNNPLEEMLKSLEPDMELKVNTTMSLTMLEELLITEEFIYQLIMKLWDVIHIMESTKILK